MASNVAPSAAQAGLKRTPAAAPWIMVRPSLSALAAYRERATQTAALLRLDARRLHHPAPAGDLGALEGAVALRAVRHHRQPDLPQPLHRLWMLQRLHHRRVDAREQ